MTREEWKAWAMSLKPGDRVIVTGWHSLEIATVKKVTPSGRVNTDKGVFAQKEWLDYYTGYGKTYGDLAPATPELIAEAEKQERGEQERRRRESVIREAKNLADKLRCGEIGMPYQMAEELVALVKKYRGAEKNEC